MSRMSGNSSGRRPRRQFSDEFKEGAVRLVLDEGKSVGAVARELDLTPSALSGWVRQARADRTKRQERADEGGARGIDAAAMKSTPDWASCIRTHFLSDSRGRMPQLRGSQQFGLPTSA